MRGAANIITSFRLVLIPFLVISLFSSYHLLAAGLFGLAIFTDFLDGFVARKVKQVTDFGKVFDPLVDRILILAVAITIFLKEILPLWALSLVISRDILVILGYIYLRKKVGVTFFGKTATFFLYLSFLLIFLKIQGGMELFYLGLGLYFISSLDYLRKALHQSGRRKYGEAPNLKHQIPNKHQYPNSN